MMNNFDAMGRAARRGAGLPEMSMEEMQAMMKKLQAQMQDDTLSAEEKQAIADKMKALQKQMDMMK